MRARSVPEVPFLNRYKMVLKGPLLEEISTHLHSYSSNIFQQRLHIF